MRKRMVTSREESTNSLRAVLTRYSAFREGKHALRARLMHKHSIKGPGNQVGKSRLDIGSCSSGNLNADVCFGLSLRNQVECRLSIGSKGLTNTKVNFRYFSVGDATKTVAFGPGLLHGTAPAVPVMFMIQARDKVGFVFVILYASLFAYFVVPHDDKPLTFSSKWLMLARGPLLHCREGQPRRCVA